jgi:hypothetical protein
MLKKQGMLELHAFEIVNTGCQICDSWNEYWHCDYTEIDFTIIFSGILMIIWNNCATRMNGFWLRTMVWHHRDTEETQCTATVPLDQGYGNRAL